MFRWFLISIFVLAASSLNAAVVKEVRVGNFNGTTRAVVELDGAAPFRISNQSEQNQTVTIEISGITSSTEAVSMLSQNMAVTGGRVDRIVSDGRIRATFKTTGPVQVVDSTLMNPPRIVLDFLSSASAPSASSPTGPRAPSVPPPSLPSAGTGGKWQRRIIIDPGHGGHHKGGKGRIGSRDVYEKEVVIVVAERLERLFRADPRFDVRLTRRQDLYLGLYERTVIASQMKGDLFISIHCNAVEGKAAQKRARGFEIWTWNREANSSAAARAMERLENEEPGVHNQQNNRILGTMMKDALESQSLESQRFAKAVHGRAAEHSYLKRHDRGIHRARFKVLEIYDMPSILVEMGFMTHPEEVKMLLDSKFQDDWARIMYEGTVRYYEQTDPGFPRQAIARR